jgi:hypothetical protein
MFKPLCLLAAATALTACASVPPAGAPLSGPWGGSHVGLMLTATEGQLEYDCAAGTIAGPLAVRADGSFEAQGTHTPGSGGPEIEGQARRVYSARYTGTVRGDWMTLAAQLENGVRLGPFILRRAAEPIIFRCL